MEIRKGHSKVLSGNTAFLKNSRKGTVLKLMRSIERENI